MEGVGILHVHLVYFKAVWYILWQYGIFYSYLVYIFSPFWYVVPRKIWQPCFKCRKVKRVPSAGANIVIFEIFSIKQLTKRTFLLKIVQPS
jgi:hypothetical protein